MKQLGKFERRSVITESERSRSRLDIVTLRINQARRKVLDALVTGLENGSVEDVPNIGIILRGFEEWTENGNIVVRAELVAYDADTVKV